MSVSKQQMPGLNIEHRVDGFTVTFEYKYRALFDLAFLSIGYGLCASFVVGLPSLMVEFPLYWLLVAFVLGVIASVILNWGWGYSSRFMTRAITVRGGNLILTGWFSEKRIPLVDVYLFRAQQCLLITNSNHAFYLAPSQPESVQHALGALLRDTLERRPAGTAADVPENLKKLHSSESLPP